MLVLSRKIDEVVQVGPDIAIRVLRIDGNRVQLAFSAPPEVRIVRGELPPHEPFVFRQNAATKPCPSEPLGNLGR